MVEDARYKASYELGVFAALAFLSVLCFRAVKTAQRFHSLKSVINSTSETQSLGILITIKVMFYRRPIWHLVYFISQFWISKVHFDQVLFRDEVLRTWGFVTNINFCHDDFWIVTIYESVTNMMSRRQFVTNMHLLDTGRVTGKLIQTKYI